MALADTEPQITWTLLRTGVNVAWDYLAGCVDPGLMDGPAKEHDATIGQAIDSLLYPRGSPKPPTTQEAEQRSNALTTLPLGMGGAGIQARSCIHLNHPAMQHLRPYRLS